MTAGAQAWPKQCACCDRVFDQQQWDSLTRRGYVGAFRAQGRVYAVELRDCICTTTLGVEVEVPMAQPAVEASP